MDPVNGTCCTCGYSAPDETPCSKQEDGAHCVHWWEGPDVCDACDGTRTVSAVDDEGNEYETECIECAR